MRILGIIIKVFLPVAVVVSSVWFAQHLIANQPEAQRRPPPTRLPTVEATRLMPQDYQVRIKTQGTVQPRTETTLVAEVTGRVIEIAPQFREGGFFEQGDVLLRIDPRDYQIAVTIAEAQVAQAQAALQQEQAQAEVAGREWRQLQRKPSDSSLALRKPQLAAAQAQLASAEAQLARARLDLERTTISAPYAGRVLEQRVDVSQYVTPATALGRIYAIDYVEVRLPLSHEQLSHVRIPERFRGPSAAPARQPAVTLSTRIGEREYHWQGNIVRAAGAIDTQSRQLFVVAQVDDPYGPSPAQRPPLRVGQFVEASIEGEVLQDVFVIPRSALREGREVLLVDAEGRLQRRPVSLAWSDAQNAVIAAGFEPGEVLSLTPVSGAASGMRVAATIDGVAPEQPQGQRGLLAKENGEREPGQQEN